ncbi:transposase [Gloeocapsopsis sp. AAB1 = 1H9]|uniref:Transposase n=2 Tax=Gloeocapsopsis TaxID=693222 RepID=A0A6N8G0X2_9CHRO|nr:transposase [Gloeocapsopsis dulcis AAB1 = 1H9]
MTQQVLTVSCKLGVEAGLALIIDATLQGFADCCNWINSTVDPKVTGRLAIHKETYHYCKQTFELPANLVCQAISRVSSNRKSAKLKNSPVKKFKPTSAGYDARIFSFNEHNWTVKLTLKDGRYSFPLLIGNYQRHLLSGKTPTSAILVKRQSGEYYIQIQVKPKPPKTNDSNECLGVDLGRKSIAYTSSGDNWDADDINKLRDHYANLRKNLQYKASKGTRSSRRRCRELLKRLSGKERRFQTWLNHTISASIVKSAANNKKIIAIEDLTGIRDDLNQEPRNREERRRTNSWAFYQLRVFLTYKCLKQGVKLISVPPAYTSKSCASCLRIGSRNGKAYECQCGWKCDSDHNASIVISKLGVSVNTPEGSSLFCSLDRDDSGLLKAHTVPLAVSAG